MPESLVTMAKTIVSIHLKNPKPNQTKNKGAIWKGNQVEMGEERKKSRQEAHSRSMEQKTLERIL